MTKVPETHEVPKDSLFAYKGCFRPAILKVGVAYRVGYLDPDNKYDALKLAKLALPSISGGFIQVYDQKGKGLLGANGKFLDEKK